MAALAIVGMLVLGAASCSDDDEGGTSTTTTSTTEVTDGSADDGGGDTTSTTTDGSTTTTGSEPATSTSAPVEGGPPPELTEVEQRYADALLADFREDPSESLPGADMECLATRWVDVIGGDALEASGSPEEFADDGPPSVGIDRATADSMVDVMEVCGAGLDRFYELWATDFGAVPVADPALVECFRQAVSLETMRDAFVRSFMEDDDDGLDAIEDRFETCVPGDD